MRPSPSITRRWAGPAALGGAGEHPRKGHGAEGAARGGQPPTPGGVTTHKHERKGGERQFISRQVREEGLEGPELPEPRQQQSRAPSSPSLPIPSRQPSPPTWAK